MDQQSGFVLCREKHLQVNTYYIPHISKQALLYYNIIYYIIV